MKKAEKNLSADEIADMAEQGKDISKFFSNKGKKKYPVKRVNVDFTVEMLHELDQVSKELNISRQALIKVYLRQALNEHYMAQNYSNQRISA